MVVLVISDAVENLSNSALEKPTTFLNISFLKSLPNAAAVLAAINVTITAAIVPTKATPSILAPATNK